MIKLKRIYEPPQPRDGFRILVDRLWPRALSKNNARVHLWLKEVAPGHSLRRWFAHDPQKWDGFREKYAKELRAKRKLLEQITRAEKENGTVTLLFAAKDEKRNNAAALKGMLRKS